MIYIHMEHIKTYENFNDLEFMSTYWAKLKDIKKRIKEELPYMKNDDHTRNVGSSKNLRVMNFKDMEDWRVPSNRSETLTALADKVCDMIDRGRSVDIPVMIEKILTGRIKKLSKPHKNFDTQFLGHGHFRWNNRAYTLNQREMERLRDYFKQ
jgi:hypothetical protein